MQVWVGWRYTFCWMKAAAVWMWAGERIHRTLIGNITLCNKVHTSPKPMSVSSPLAFSIDIWLVETHYLCGLTGAPSTWKPSKQKKNYRREHFVQKKYSLNVSLPLPHCYPKIIPCLLKLLPSLIPTAWGKFWSKQASLLSDLANNAILSHRKCISLTVSLWRLFGRWLTGLSLADFINQNQDSV